MLQRAFVSTGITYPFPDEFNTAKEKRGYVASRITQLHAGGADNFEPPMPRPPVTKKIHIRPRQEEVEVEAPVEAPVEEPVVNP